MIKSFIFFQYIVYWILKKIQSYWKTTHLCTLWNKNVFEQKYVILLQLSDNQFNYHSSPHFQLGGSSPQTVLSQGAIEKPTLTQVFFSEELNKNLLIKWPLVVHKPFKSHPKQEKCNYQLLTVKDKIPLFKKWFKVLY